MTAIRVAHAGADYEVLIGKLAQAMPRLEALAKGRLLPVVSDRRVGICRSRQIRVDRRFRLFRLVRGQWRQAAGWRPRRPPNGNRALRSRQGGVRHRRPRRYRRNAGIAQPGPFVRPCDRGAGRPRNPPWRGGHGGHGAGVSLFRAPGTRLGRGQPPRLKPPCRGRPADDPCRFRAWRARRRVVRADGAGQESGRWRAGAGSRQRDRPGDAGPRRRSRKPRRIPAQRRPGMRTLGRPDAAPRANSFNGERPVSKISGWTETRHGWRRARRGTAAAWRRAGRGGDEPGQGRRGPARSRGRRRSPRARR